MTIKFYPRGKKLYCRVTITEKYRPSYATKIPANENGWDKRNMRFKLKNSKDKATRNVNEQLDLLEDYLMEKIRTDYTSSKEITSSTIKHYIEAYFNRPQWERDGVTPEEKDLYFVPWARNWTDNALDSFVKDNHGIFSKKDRRRYNNCLPAVEDYEQKHGRITIKAMDKDLKARLINFWIHGEDRLENSTVSAYVQRVNWLLKRYIKDNEQYLPIESLTSIKSFLEPVRLPRSQKQHYDMVYLNEEEICKIRDVRLLKTRLQYCRDYFIIACRTALRSSDYLFGLERGVIDRINKKTSLRTKKTGALVTIPMHPDVQEILDRHGGLPPNPYYNKSGNTNQFNQDLKEVCKEAGLTSLMRGGVKQVIEKNGKRKTRMVVGQYPKYKLVSAHTARRSFASNLYLNDDISDRDIMELGGWSDIKSMKGYIKSSGITRAGMKLEKTYHREDQQKQASEL